MDNQLRLGDADGSDARVLIVALDRALATVPLSTVDVDTRAGIVRSIIRRLADLGLDGESLIRYGMAPRAALPLLVKLVGSAEDKAVDLASWRSVLSIPAAALDADPDLATDALITSVHRIDSWVIAAPLSEVLNFTAPSATSLSRYVIDNQSRTTISLPYIWLWLRCTQDDLTRWPTEALHLEYRWQNDLEEAPFPAAVLEHDGPNSTVLNEQIAYRASTSSASDEGEDSLFWQLQDTAVSFLSRERYDEASALFEFHSKHHPKDARSLNNLGFCKLPIDPATSLDLLERAESAGYSPLLINVYNQCCCLIRLNRLAEALDRAEFFWQRESDPDQIRGGYIWVEQEAGWDLVAHDLIDEALARLMADAARALGRSDRADRWESRAEAITESYESTDSTSLVVDD
ncbi:hypothetical protein ACFY9N_01165 [Microbacterium sp. NPDC008134]|uniref:hypothetical protein n=1 Tax=Microbacterium sp. NPDC008134 TaxID=3364183 RepID=UPI0036E1EDBB